MYSHASVTIGILYDVVRFAIRHDAKTNDRPVPRATLYFRHHYMLELHMAEGHKHPETKQKQKNESKE